MDSPEADASDAEDVAWMLAVKAGDEDAFEALVAKHQMRVVGTVAKMLGGERDAEDVAQQVFLRVWQSAPRYEHGAKFTTWLLTITRNLVFNELRRRRRSRLVDLDPGDEPGGREFPDPHNPTPSRAALGAELEAVVAAAIAALPEAQRLAVVLRRYEEMPYEEIAKVLGTSVPSVKSLLFRARTELKERLAPYLGV